MASTLAREQFLAVAELTGTAARSRIVLAATIALSEIEAIFGDEVETIEQVTFDPETLSLRGRRLRRLGAISLAEAPLAVVASDNTAPILAVGVTKLGLDRLPWTKAREQWRDRVLFLRRAEGEEWPDLSNTALATRADEWLAPLLADKSAIGQIRPEELDDALAALLPFRFAAGWKPRRRHISWLHRGRTSQSTTRQKRVRRSRFGYRSSSA